MDLGPSEGNHDKQEGREDEQEKSEGCHDGPEFQGLGIRTPVVEPIGVDQIDVSGSQQKNPQFSNPIFDLTHAVRTFA